MSNRISLLAVTLSAVAVLACRTSRTEPVRTGVPQPATSKTSNINDDANQRRSIAEGGPTTGYVLVGVIDRVEGDRVMIRRATNRLQPDVNDEMGLAVTDDTRITIEGQPAHLDDLQEGMPVRAAYDLAHRAQAIQVSRDALDQSQGKNSPRP